MKTKRCTNSSCRRTFRAESLACPHCGKRYPRASAHTRYAVILTYIGLSKLAVIRAMRQVTGRSLKDLKAIADNTPSLIGTGFQASQAEALKEKIRAAGGDAMIVPASRGTRGVFVLPGKTG